MIPYVSPYFQPLIPLLESVRKTLILPIKTQGGVLQSNRNFTHDEFIDGIVTVLAKLPEKYWLPVVSKVPLPQSGMSSAVQAIPSTPSSSSTVLPNNPLPRLPLIRMTGTTSAGNPKRRLESGGESGSRLAKRRTQIGETVPPFAGALDLDGVDADADDDVSNVSAET